MKIRNGCNFIYKTIKISFISFLLFNIISTNTGCTDSLAFSQDKDLTKLIKNPLIVKDSNWNYKPIQHVKSWKNIHLWNNSLIKFEWKIYKATINHNKNDAVIMTLYEWKLPKWVKIPEYNPKLKVGKEYILKWIGSKWIEYKIKHKLKMERSLNVDKTIKVIKWKLISEEDKFNIILSYKRKDKETKKTYTMKQRVKNNNINTKIKTPRNLIKQMKKNKYARNFFEKYHFLAIEEKEYNWSDYLSWSPIYDNNNNLIGIACKVIKINDKYFLLFTKAIAFQKAFKQLAKKQKEEKRILKNKKESEKYARKHYTNK